MNTNDENFLNSLLQYHTHLVDQQFLDRVITKLEINKQRRYRIMIITLLIASFIAAPMMLNIVEDFEFLVKLSQLSPYLITLGLLSTLGFTAWLTSEDF